MTTTTFTGKHRNVIFARIFIMLLLLSVFLRADETGTFLLVAHTADFAILVIDSKITDTSGVMSEINSEGKLLEVGNTGACAIEGWGGHKVEGVVLANNLRDVVAASPQKNVAELLQPLLRRSAETWNSMHYSFAEMAQMAPLRRAGSSITTLVCVDLIQSTPTLFRARTRVNSDGTAIYEVLPDKCSGLLYVYGYMDLPTYVEISQNPRSAQLNYRDPILAKIANDLRVNADALSAFRTWQTVSKATVQNGRLTCPNSYLQDVDPTWSIDVVHRMAQSIFSTIEKNFDGVAPPNNARIISIHGKFAETLESDWTTHLVLYENSKAWKPKSATKPVYLDGEAIGSLHVGSVLRHDILAGSHTLRIGSASDQNASFVIAVDPSSLSYYKLLVRKGKFLLVPVESTQAEKELTRSNSKSQ